MSEQVGSIFYEVTLDTAQMVQGQRRVQGELDKTTGSLDKFSAKLTGVAAAIGVYASALYLIEKSDAFTKMNAQLKLATDSAREFAIAQADVRKIAQESQSEIGSVASLYAKVTTSTKEMGLAQSTVADITRSVSLALKVSGASAAESGAAIMQLGQAFASGVLRGDEFNSIAEASPRLMKALADGIGVPIGQLRSMAEAGKLTSEVLAGALPRALKDLEQEAKQIQTISGAFQELKNEVMLFIGEQSTASGAVKIVAGSISALSNNLGLLAGVLGTVAAVKFAIWLESIVTQTYATVAANAAMRASNLSSAQAQVVATASTVALTSARVAELRASVLAAGGSTALAITTNGLIPAQTRAAVAADAHAVALGALSVAQRAASVTGAAATGVLSLLGGPIGAIVTVLGLGVTAWAMWGSAAKKESENAADIIEASGREIIASVEKQNAKLRERITLAKAGNVDAAKTDNRSTEALASTLTKINAIKAKGNNLTLSDKLQLIEYEATYRDITAALVTNKQLTSDISELGQQSKASEWLVKYATDAERANAEVAKAKKELGSAFTPELEKRIRSKVGPKRVRDEPTPDEKFDDAGYLANLKTKTVDGLDAINAAEESALRKNQFLLEREKIGRATHEQAITLIATAAEEDRNKLRQRGLDDLIAQETRAFDEREALAQRKASARQASTLSTLGMNAEGGGIGAQEALIQAQAQAAMDAAEQARLLDLNNSQVYADQKTAIEAKMHRDIDALRTNANTAAMNSTADIFGSLVSITKGAAGEQSDVYKAMFDAQKAFSIAQSIIAIQTGIAQASALPFPANLGAMATVAAATAGIVATINSTSVSGRQYGGAVSSGSLYRVNEKGSPEMFTAGNGSQYMLPTTGGSVTAADKLGGNGQSAAMGMASVKVVFNVVQDTSKAGSAQQRQGSDGANMIDVFVAQIESKMAEGISRGAGPLNSAMQQTFGLNRAPGAY